MAVTETTAVTTVQKVEARVDCVDCGGKGGSRNISQSHFSGPDIQKTVSKFQPNTSVLKIIEEGLRRNGDHTALVEGDTGKRISFSQLLQQSSSIAVGLQQASVSSGDVVVLCCNKSILAYSIFLGVIFTGATAVVVPPLYADTIDKLTSGQEVKAMFYDTTVSESVSQSVARMTPRPSPLSKVDAEDPTVATLLKSTQELKVFTVNDVKKHVPVVFFSSGTTGFPKGIEMSDLAVQLSGVLDKETSKIVLNPSPFFWFSALSSFLSSIINNNSLILTNNTDARHILQLIEKYKVETFFCNMANMTKYVKEPMSDDFDISSVKTVITAGETVLATLARQFFTKVLRGRASLMIAYGSTEAGLISNLNIQDEESIQLGICGQIYPGVEIKILNEHGDPVELGVVGKIWTKSQAAKGYWRRDDLNSSFLDNEGFHDTGDAGCFDTEGNLYLRGRICDLINFRGTKMSPCFLEDLLIDHPAILTVAVIGTPHPSDGQHPTAYVVLRPEYQETVTNHDIMAYVGDRAEDSMRLRGGVHFRDNLPRGVNGKLIRTIL